MLRRLFHFMMMTLLVLPTASGYAQDALTLEVNKKIIDNIKDKAEIMQNLEYLSDMIGPRLTGSANLKAANEWTRQRFVDYGCTNAHQENWKFGLGWSRGTATGRILEPSSHPLTLASYGWAPGTNGTVRGELMFVDARRPEDLEKYKGQLKGKFIVQRPPSDLQRPAGMPPEVAQMLGQRRDGQQPPATPGAPAPQTPATPTPPAQPAPAGTPPAEQPPRDLEQARQMRERITQFLKEEGVLVSIADSAKEHGLLNMGGLGGRDPKAPVLPSVFVTHEDYALLWRLLQRKMKVVLEMNISNSFTATPIDAYNTVAEIRGTEKPDEIVIIGGHLDSWDLGTGVTDNGTGTMAVLEACRALNAVDAKPKRTIRFILWSGEEQGLLGSRAYAEQHKDELAKVSAVLVLDTGTGRVRGITLQGREDVRPMMAGILAPLNELGVQEISLRSMGGTDHASFAPLGVPAFAFSQDPIEYGKTHHSQSDTFDKAKKEDLIQAATVLAVSAFNIAQLPDVLPHRIPPPRTPAPAPAPTQ